MYVRDEAVKCRVAWEQGTVGIEESRRGFERKSYVPVLGFPKTILRFF